MGIDENFTQYSPVGHGGTQAVTPRQGAVPEVMVTVQTISLSLNYFPQMCELFFTSGCVVSRLEMEMDSASPVPVIPYEFYQKHFSNLSIIPSPYIFGSYSNNTMPILGFIMLTIFIENSAR